MLVILPWPVLSDALLGQLGLCSCFLSSSRMKQQGNGDVTHHTARVLANLPCLPHFRLLFDHSAAFASRFVGTLFSPLPLAQLLRMPAWPSRCLVLTDALLIWISITAILFLAFQPLWSQSLYINVSFSWLFESSCLNTAGLLSNISLFAALLASHSRVSLVCISLCTKLDCMSSFSWLNYDPSFVQSGYIIFTGPLLLVLITIIPAFQIITVIACNDTISLGSTGPTTALH